MTEQAAGISASAAAQACDRVLAEVGRAVVGKRGRLALVLAGILAGGHVLIEDNPGLAKTLAARSFAQALGLEFRRIQFTPDLLPSDITGSFVYDQRSAEFVFRSGPLFAGLVLADEINRTPPKTQAALLEAMQEHRVTVQGRTYQLPEPFFVFATQNPIELEGTYPLPEAQLDRFMFEIVMDYLDADDEVSVVQSTTALPQHKLTPVIEGEALLAFQRLVRQVPVAEQVVRYSVDLVRASHCA